MRALKLAAAALLAFSAAPAEVPQRQVWAPLSYLARVMDRFHLTFDVYSDAGAAGNHFLARGRMSNPGGEQAVPPMEEDWTHQPAAGLTAIRARFEARGNNWGGWYFLNGVLHGGEIAPRADFGQEPKAGLDLRGVTRLTFQARGERGGERVEFFCLGVGRDPATGRAIAPHPDSDRKASTGWVTLSNTWQTYSIPLEGKDLSYVVGGFGWVTSAPANAFRSITFYLDEIRYDKARLEEPRFLTSYETRPSGEAFDAVLRNTAFAYDNAVALQAFLASGQRGRARLLAEAFLTALDRDRYWKDGRIRNAYQAGDLLLPPGWRPFGQAGTIRLPGWYDSRSGRWLEDEHHVSTHTGNVAWAMLALLSYFEVGGETRMLEAVERMGEWVERHCRDGRGAGGYTAGYQGWEPAPRKLAYKATEHNIDLYAAFRRLHRVSRDPKWQERADWAKRFLLAMWDPRDGKFWTGTLDDGVTINRSVVPLDVQAWAVLALGEEGVRFARALAYAEKHHRAGEGFDFNEDCDGIWYEGTAQLALAFRHTGQERKSRAALRLLGSARPASGGLVAAERDRLTTGFFLPSGEPWYYFRRLHVGATAWLVLAELGANPSAPFRPSAAIASRGLPEAAGSSSTLRTGRQVAGARACRAGSPASGRRSTKQR